MGVMLLPTGLRGHPSAQAARRASSGVRRSPTASKMSVGHSRSVSTPDAVGATKAVVTVPRTAPPAAPAIVTAVAAWAWGDAIGLCGIGDDAVHGVQVGQAHADAGHAVAHGQPPPARSAENRGGHKRGAEDEARTKKAAASVVRRR